MKKTSLGFTLIELLIAVGIGLVLMLLVTRIFISNYATSRFQDDNERMQEEVYFAFNLMKRSLAQAGYGDLLSSGGTDFVGKALEGCDRGFASIPTTAAEYSCALATVNDRPWFAVSYRGADVFVPERGAGTDCNGYDTSLASPAGGIILNRFFIAANAEDGSTALYCAGNGMPPAGEIRAHPLVRRVTKMVLQYGVDTQGRGAVSRFMKNAGEVQSLPPNSQGQAGWDQVIGVRVCLEVRNQHQLSQGNSSYTDCEGNTRTPTDGYFYRIFSQFFTLRNHAAPTLTPT